MNHGSTRGWCIAITMLLTCLGFSYVPAYASTYGGPIVGRVIVVDAGHGGPDSGARGIHGIEEKSITLGVANRLTALLREAGAMVVQTRSVDTDLATAQDRAQHRRHNGDLRGRLNKVRKSRADAFVSVHCDAAPSSVWYGSHVLYLRGNDEAERLAKMMQASFQNHLLPTHRAIEPNRSLFLLKRIDGPAVLAEVGFVTNPVEGHQLTTPQYQEKVAFSMYISLMQYFEGEQVPTS